MTEAAPRFESFVQIASDHPAFAGHFPGAPMLPGALLAALVIEALTEVPAMARPLDGPMQIDELKLFSPIRPGALLCIALWPLGRGIAFEVRDGSTVAARGRLGGVSTS